MPDPLNAHCPQCSAAPGERCQDYRGKHTAPHRRRKFAADPEATRRFQARLKTEREQAKALKDTPLFAEEALADAAAGRGPAWHRR